MKNFGRKTVQTLAVAVALLAFAPHMEASAATLAADTYGGRSMIVYNPPNQSGAPRAMVVVLHGGGGSAQRIVGGTAESALDINAAAQKNGFVVAYLDGTQAARWLPPGFLAWNAGGGCCGLPALSNVDDMTYIQGAVGYLAAKYGIDKTRVYGLGHSNGAIMAQRLTCDSTVFAAEIAISGPLNIPVSTCPSASGRRVLAIQGADDTNVPVNGGKGTTGPSNATFVSAAQSQQVFLKSGAAYTLDILPNTDHNLDHIQTALGLQGTSVSAAAVSFFNLAR